MAQLQSTACAVAIYAIFGIGHAFASDSNAYVNIGISQLSADADLTDLSVQGNPVNLGEQSLKIQTVTGRIGYKFMPQLAIEAEAGVGLGGDGFDAAVPVNVNGLGTVNVDTQTDLDIKSYAGVFARSSLPLGDQFEVFARGGYGIAKLSADVTATAAGFTAAGSESESVNDFAYGIGAQYNITDRHGIRLDYAAVGSEFDVITLSYAVNF